jgi:hypothetical protein
MTLPMSCYFSLGLGGNLTVLGSTVISCKRLLT